MALRLNSQGQLVEDGGAGGIGFAIPSTGMGSYTPQSLAFGTQQQPTLGTGYGGIGGVGNTGTDSTGWLGIDGLGANMDTLKIGIGGLATIGNLWNAFQSQKLAKQQFNYIRDVTDTNLANQIKSYNTTLEDRARSRGVMEGQDQSQVDSYIDKNRLSR